MSNNNRRWFDKYSDEDDNRRFIDRSRICNETDNLMLMHEHQRMLMQQQDEMLRQSMQNSQHFINTSNNGFPF